MRVLIVHNRYRKPGGEDVVFEAEARLLRSRGVEVNTMTFDNASLGPSVPVRRKATLALRAVWSREAADKIRREAGGLKADVVHFHNTFPLVSPAGYSAARSTGAAVVQTLHNYRLICPNALLLRDGRPCEDCVVRRVAWPGVRHACYRDSSLQSAVVAAMQTTHRLLGTWNREVDRYIALSAFGRSRFISGGIQPELVEVRRNFVDGPANLEEEARRGFLYVGRLDQSKGVQVLLEAWRSLPFEGELLILGDGPLLETIRAEFAGWAGVRVPGFARREDVLESMKGAVALVFPSIWYEGCPMTIAEAYSCGTPVIGSRLGAIHEMVGDGETGLLFEPRDSADLTEKLTWAATHPDQMASMGRMARRTYEDDYSPDRGFETLMGIYARAIERRRAGQ